MIKFWRTTDKYGAFSNFAKFGFVIDDAFWPTNEHYYQAQKTTDPAQQAVIRKIPGCKAAKAFATEMISLRSDWEDVKFEVMLTGLRAKFSQTKSIKELLLSTGDEELVEDSPYDYIWGCGKDGSGQNLLGKALMQIRSEFQERKQE